MVWCCEKKVSGLKAKKFFSHYLLAELGRGASAIAFAASERLAFEITVIFRAASNCAIVLSFSARIDASCCSCALPALSLSSISRSILCNGNGNSRTSSSGPMIDNLFLGIAQLKLVQFGLEDSQLHRIVRGAHLQDLLRKC